MASCIRAVHFHGPLSWGPGGSAAPAPGVSPCPGRRQTRVMEHTGQGQGECVPRTCAPGGGVRERPSRGTPLTRSPSGWEGLPGEGAAGMEAQSPVPGIPEGLAELGREQGRSGDGAAGWQAPREPREPLGLSGLGDLLSATRPPTGGRGGRWTGRNGTRAGGPGGGHRKSSRRSEGPRERIWGGAVRAAPGVGAPGVWPA